MSKINDDRSGFEVNELQIRSRLSEAPPCQRVCLETKLPDTQKFDHWIITLINDDRSGMGVNELQMGSWRIRET